MCLSAIYWSHIDRVFYANTRDDARNIDFDDNFIYSEINKKIEDRKIQMIQMHSCLLYTSPSPRDRG